MKFALVGAFAVLFLAGCGSRNVDSLEAVKQGVIRDISKNVNVGAMDVNVVSVSFRDKEADAVVSFAPKGGTAAQGLTMSYTLERQGADWHIKKRAQADLQKHAGQAGPMGNGAGAAQQQDLPPGHPTTGGSPQTGQQLPPGHPPLNGSKQ